jgi:hypothetical protein
MTSLPSWFRVAARVRGVATRLGPPLLVVGLIGVWLLTSVLPAAAWAAVCIAGVALWAVAFVLTIAPGAPQVDPVVLAPPVAGRWIALNSPTDRVPSHGTHGLAQTWAVDLVYEPREGTRPAFGTGAWFRDPSDYPGFGAQILAPADATVALTSDGARDHRSRSSWPAFALMLADGMARDLLGARHLLGNHVVLDLGGGVHAVLAHLQRGSIAVRPGERVHRGQVVARCGNSGNSSEPHLHLQLMDSAHPTLAAGIPFTFGDAGMPRNGEPLDPSASPDPEEVPT